MKLIPKRKAPELVVPRVGGGDWSLTEQNPDKFLMLVFYRGYHCPICKTYLETLNGLLDDASNLGVSVFTISGDTQERASKSRAEWNIDDLGIGYSMTVAQMNEWGLYASASIKEEEPDVFGEPALFLIKPDQTLYYAAYNSMPMGRPDPKEVLEFVKFALKKDYPARGERTTDE
jgi:peroxiredoxin